jgi:hypothetical protein
LRRGIGPVDAVQEDEIEHRVPVPRGRVREAAVAAEVGRPPLEAVDLVRFWGDTSGALIERACCLLLRVFGVAKKEGRRGVQYLTYERGV